MLSMVRVYFSLKFGFGSGSEHFRILGFGFGSGSVLETNPGSNAIDNDRKNFTVNANQKYI